jgi:hypothetical protein
MSKRIDDYPHVQSSLSQARAALNQPVMNSNDFWSRLNEGRKSYYLKQAGIENDGRHWVELTTSERYRIEKTINGLLDKIKADAHGLGVSW